MGTTHLSGLEVGGVPVLPGMGGLGVVAFRKVYFVDNKRGNDSNTGLSVEEAFSSVQSAVDLVQDEDTIVVFKGTGNYNEKITTGQNIRHADLVDGRGRNVTLAGATHMALPYNSPQLYNVDSTEYTLFVRSPAWRITGFRIVADTGAPRGLLAEMAQAANTAGTNWAVGLQIDHCTFYGYVDTSNGGLLISGLGDLKVFDCLFGGFGSSTLAALGFEQSSLVTVPPFTHSQAQIRRNNFSDNALNIVVPLSGAVIMDNVIGGQNGTNALATDGGIDLRTGGGNNVVSRNILGGTWETGGHYRQAADSDDWSGNIVQGGVVTGMINPPFTSSKPGQ